MADMELTEFNPTQAFDVEQVSISLNGDENRAVMAFMFLVGDQRPAFVFDIGPMNSERRQKIEAVAARLLQLLAQNPEN